MYQLLRFEDPKQMLEHITQDGEDLYNTKTGEYVFAYNEDNAICVYTIDPEHATQLARKTTQTKSQWSEFLGMNGSAIYDTPKNIQWCINSYASDFWIHTKDYLAYMAERKED